MGVRREGGLWRVQVQVKGRRTSTTTRTREEAEGIQARIRRDRALSRQGLPPERSLEQALTRWLDEYVPHLKRPETYESHIRAILPFCNNCRVEDAPQVWERYVEASRGLTNSTNNRRGAALRRVANLAAKWGWCASDIGRRIELLPENSSRHIYLTQPQVKRLLAKIASRPCRDALLIAVYSGLRIGEVLRLEPGDVISGCLHVRTSKNGKPRIVPIHDAIRAPVARLPIGMSRRGVAKHFERARAAVGHPEWHIHDLRHTNASWLIAAGADLVTVRDLLGHSSLSITGRYAHLSTAHLRQAVRRIRS